MIRTLYLLRGSIRSIVSRADRRPVDSDRKLAKKSTIYFSLQIIPLRQLSPCAFHCSQISHVDTFYAILNL